MKTRFLKFFAKNFLICLFLNEGGGSADLIVTACLAESRKIPNLLHPLKSA